MMRETLSALARKHASALFLVADESEVETPWWVVYCCGEKVFASVSEVQADAKVEEMRKMVMAAIVGAVTEKEKIDARI